jgi:hypothetical protein
MVADKDAPAKVSSMPCIIISGLGHDRTMVTFLGKFLYQQALTISVRIADDDLGRPAGKGGFDRAFTSCVINSRKRPYSNPCGLNWSPVTTPTIPSMSAEM